MAMKRFSHSIAAKAYQPTNPAKALGGRWTRMRRIHIMGNPHCVKCGRPGDEVHHVVPRCVDSARRFDWDNLETVCAECHRKIHADSRKKAKITGR